MGTLYTDMFAKSATTLFIHMKVVCTMSNLYGTRMITNNKMQLYDQQDLSVIFEVI